MEFVELVGIIETKQKENAEKFIRSQSATSLRTLSVRSSSISVDSTELSEIDIEVDVNCQMESNTKGKVEGSMVKNYFTAGVKWPILMAVLFSFLFAQMIGSTFDYHISRWYVIRQIEFYHCNLIQ